MGQKLPYECASRLHMVHSTQGALYWREHHERQVRMLSNITVAMRIVELHADGWVTAMDFVNALKKAIGAPDWHGSSPDAFLDSMIYHDEINALKSPYTIRIVGLDKAKPEAQDEIRLLARLIDEHGASDRGGDLEVTILVEDSS